ncbi:MAG: AAA family ATPase [Pseudomonadota bacterium]
MAMTAQDNEALAVSTDTLARLAGDAPAQAEIVAAFAQGLATGEAPLDHVVTHMSHVFLGRERAYKLARARAHGFGDFSTLAARRAACLAEFTLNRGLAPALYETVKPVRMGPGGKVHIGGGGRLVDWVIIMHRFAPGALFSELARDQHLTADHVIGAVDAVVRAHRVAAPLMQDGGVQDYQTILSGLRKSHAAALGSGCEVEDAETLFKTLGEQLRALAPLLERRRQDGWTRRGHGDLHLRNICVFEGQVTLFDALAFDETLATGDVLYDLAFLLMDLQARGLAPYANLAMNRYWDETQQPEWALALLASFMALRAVVRMTVAEEAGDREEAALYHRLALRLLDLPHPRLLAIGGLSGCGKSTVARLVAPGLPGACGARVLRTDVIRKLAGPDAPGGQSADYSSAGRRAVYQRLATAAQESLGAGTSVVADATFADSLARDQFSAVFAEKFTGVWLRASQATRLARVAARRNDASDATAAVVLRQVDPVDLGPEWVIVEAEGSPDRVAERVISAAREALANVPPG